VVWEVHAGLHVLLLPYPNDVLCLCSCARAPDGEVDKLFLDKLPGADGMRVVTVDGLICLAAIDFTAAVCATTANEAAVKLSKLSCHERDGAYVSKLLSRKHQFPGQGQRPTPVITFSEAIKLLCYLPRMHTGAMMDYVVDTFTRLMAGDAGLLRELTHNARSDGLAQTAARNELGIAKAQNSIELASASGQVELSGAHKRKWLELDVAEREAANARTVMENIKDEMEIVKGLSGGMLEEKDRARFLERVRGLGAGPQPAAAEPCKPPERSRRRATPLMRWLSRLCVEGSEEAPRSIDAGRMFQNFSMWSRAEGVYPISGPAHFGKELKDLCCLGLLERPETTRFTAGGLVYVKSGGATTYTLLLPELEEHLRAHGCWAP